MRIEWIPKSSLLGACLSSAAFFVAASAYSAERYDFSQIGPFISVSAPLFPTVGDAGDVTFVVPDAFPKLYRNGIEANFQNPDELNYRWTPAPSNPPTFLSHYASPTAFFRPEVAGTYTFQLEVRQYGVTSDPAPNPLNTVVITVSSAESLTPGSNNICTQTFSPISADSFRVPFRTPPVADAGSNLNCQVGDVVVLNGLGSRSLNPTTPVTKSYLLSALTFPVSDQSSNVYFEGCAAFGIECDIALGILKRQTDGSVSSVIHESMNFSTIVENNQILRRQISFVDSTIALPRGFLGGGSLPPLAYVQFWETGLNGTSAMNGIARLTTPVPTILHSNSNAVEDYGAPASTPSGWVAFPFNQNQVGQGVRLFHPDFGFFNVQLDPAENGPQLPGDPSPTPIDLSQMKICEFGVAMNEYADANFVAIQDLVFAGERMLGTTKQQMIFMASKVGDNPWGPARVIARSYALADKRSSSSPFARLGPAMSFFSPVSKKASRPSFRVGPTCFAGANLEIGTAEDQYGNRFSEVAIYGSTRTAGGGHLGVFKIFKDHEPIMVPRGPSLRAGLIFGGRGGMSHNGTTVYSLGELEGTPGSEIWRATKRP